LRCAASNTTVEQITDSATRLWRRIVAWIRWRNSVYSTVCQVEVDPPPAVDELVPDDHLLEMPSAIHDSLLLSKPDKIAKLRSLELRLRVGVAEDSVREVRRQVSIRSLFESEDGTTSASAPTTRAKNSLLAAQDRVCLHPFSHYIRI